MPHTAEREARYLLSNLGISDRGPVPLGKVVDRLIGQHRVRSVPPTALRFAQGALVRVHGQWEIFHRSDLKPEQRRFVVAHEVGHFVFDRGEEKASEDLCDRFAAALLLPEAGFAASFQADARIAAIAGQFMTTQAAAALRTGEVIGVPLCLLSQARVRVRGAPHSWPSELELLKARGRKILPGIEKLRLSDGYGHVVLVAA